MVIFTGEKGQCKGESDGTKHAATFANQVNKTETVRNPNDFGDLVRGLSIYGRKVVSPDALVVGVVA